MGIWDLPRRPSAQVWVSFPEYGSRVVLWQRFMEAAEGVFQVEIRTTLGCYGTTLGQVNRSDPSLSKRGLSPTSTALRNGNQVCSCGGTFLGRVPFLFSCRFPF